MDFLMVALVPRLSGSQTFLLYDNEDSPMMDSEACVCADSLGMELLKH